MRNNSFAGNLNKVWMLALVAFMVACSQFEAQGPDDVNMGNAEELASAFNLNPYGFGLESARTAGPVFVPDGTGGNVSCTMAADEIGKSPDIDIEGGFISFPASGTGGNNYNASNNTFENSFPDGFKISVTEGKFVAWSFEPVFIGGVKYCLKNLIVIVKGGPGANAYYYGEGQTSDSGLISPPVGNDNTPNLSNLRICYNLVRCDDEPCYDFVWKGETAWASVKAGINKYNTNRNGNWATWVTRDALKDGVKLFAGQTLFAGNVTSAGTENGLEITIVLEDGWRFKAGNESVKIQGYDTNAPTGNPNPGGFAWKNAAIDGNTATIEVGINDFYGIHVDVERRTAEKIEVECPIVK